FMIYAIMAAYLTLCVPRFFHFTALASATDLIGLMIPFLLAVIFFGMALSCIVRYRENVMLLVVFTSIPLLFMTGISWPQPNMPGIWQSIAQIFPSTFGVRGFLRISSMGGTLDDIEPEFIALWLQAVIYFFITCAVYRYQINRTRRQAYDRMAMLKAKAATAIFVIDEINRGELSKIFGELFFSIDPGYRGVKGKVKTQYHNLWKNSVDETQKRFGDTDFFYILENVYIIGTMNDIDRSVECMDFAMRRRFAFKEVLASDRLNMIRNDKTLGKASDEIIKRLENLNLCILSIQGLSNAYQIGAAYFLKLKNYLKDDNSIAPESWESLWKNHIHGLLFEYLRGFPDAQESMNQLYEAFQLKSTYSQTGGKIIKVDNDG
ncbi:ABC transporter permease, partial [Prevotella multiformis]|uniref:ABC transporter permease n=1 Tax=Prevotella multiformis TaxID=282402 RepID=UPI0023F4E40E